MCATRIKLTGQTASYHLVARIVAGEKLLDDVSKEMLSGMLQKMAEFCGMEVITYCMMANPMDPKSGWIGVFRREP